MSGLMLFVCVPPECAAPGAAGQELVPVEVEPMATANDVVEQLRRTGTVRCQVDLHWQGRQLDPSDILADVGLCPQSTVSVCAASSRPRLRTDGGGGSGSTGWSDWVWGGLGYLPSALGLYKPEFNFLVLGIDYTGKHTLIRHMEPASNDDRSHCRCHIGRCIVDMMVLSNKRCTRALVTQAYEKAHGVLFVVDAADSARFPEAKAELDRLLVDERLANVPFCVLGNKDDHPSACSEAELQVALGLQGITTGKDVSETNRSHVPLELFMCSLTKRLGAVSGVRWLLSHCTRS
eukprot:Hpha_TRINITY_DN16795_c1_g4::TRINITY_DN16795_c1_g4_i9::g.78253::m.78253/K07953/SAR1; GTP-binding protein SAR1